MTFSPHDKERLLIGHVLVYGSDAAKYVLPTLTHDRFVYSKEGGLDGVKDHLRIWKAITLAYTVDKVTPSIPAVLDRLNEQRGEYHAYLNSLVTALQGYYQVYEFDPRYIMKLAEDVDKAGMVYRTAAQALPFVEVLKSPEMFAKLVNEIEDPDVWLNNHVSKLTGIARADNTGYVHISDIYSRRYDEIERIHRGEQVTLLPIGMPSLTSNGLFPARKLVVVHGMSNSGKSAFTHQVNVATAIGLKHYGIKGCVAVNSLEEDELSLLLKIGGLLAGVNMWKFSMGTGISPMEKLRLDAAMEYASTLPIYIDPTNLLTASLMDMRVTGLHASDAGPVWQMSVDYLERFDLSGEKADNKEQQLDAAIHKLFNLSRTLDACVIVISQSSYSNGSGKFKIAGAEGTRYSRSIQHAADIITELWNPCEMEKAGIDFDVPADLNKNNPWLLIEKYRGGPKGKPVAMGWIPEHQRFVDFELNPAMNSDPDRITLFSHQMPDFYQLAAESAGF